MWPTLQDIDKHEPAYVDSEEGRLRTGEWCYRDDGVRGFKLGTFGDKVVMAWEKESTDINASSPYHHQEGAMELFGEASTDPALGAGGANNDFVRKFNKEYSSHHRSAS